MHPMTQFIVNALATAADPKQAAAMQAYMKTDQPFSGVKAQPRKEIIKQAATAYKVEDLENYQHIVQELWNLPHREEMYAALEIASRYKKYIDGRSFPMYESLIRQASNWDTLDWLAGSLAGKVVEKERQFENQLIQWSDDPNFWVRRAAILAHLKHGPKTNTILLSSTILKLAHEKEFFIRKAIGWVLRQYARHNPDWVRAFLDEHGGKLAALSIREASKHL